MSRSPLVVLPLLILLASCLPKAPVDQKGDESPAPETPQASVAGSEILFPSGGTVETVHLEGAVEILRGTEILAPRPGTLLALADRVRTGGDGTVEIRLSDLASVRILPSSEAVLKEIRLSEGRARAEIFLSSGTALFTVRRLSTLESFVVTTPRTVSGVRGTRFRVSVGVYDAAAVLEGRVTVVPAGPALDRIIQEARINAVARAALRVVLDQAPEAGPSQEIRVDEAAQARASEGYERLEAFLSRQPSVLPAPETAEEALFAVGPLPPLPASDASTQRAFAGARDAAAAVKPYFTALPVNAGPETLRGFERFRDSRAAVAPSPKDPALLGGIRLSSRPISGSLIRIPDTGTLVAADEGGNLYAFDEQGKVLWTLNTGNPGDPRTYPVSFKGVAYYEGDSEILAVDGRDGSVLARRALDPGRQAGSRPSPFPDALLLPTSSGFDLLDPQTLRTKSSVEVAGGPGTLPTQRDAFALVMSKDGTLYLMDPVDGSVRAQTPTGARGSTSVSPRIFENRACFADRSGLVVMVDLAQMKVLWERRTGVEILADIEIAREGVLVYGGATLFGYRLDGESLMPPISGVSAPPLLSNGTVYFGTLEGDLVVAQASPWRIRGRVPLGDIPSARPLQLGDTVYVGTRGGRLVRIDAAKLP